MTIAAIRSWRFPLEPGVRPLFSTAAVAAALVALPWLVSDYQRVFVAEIFVWGLFALSFALVYGYGGMLSFAQAIFFGAGCYGFNVAIFYLSLNTWGALAMAMASAVLFAVPIGYVATRVREHHFLIVTVIFSVLVHTVLSSGHWNWIAGPYVTRSLTFVPEVPLGVVTFSYSDETVVYYFTTAVIAVAFVACWLVAVSPFGRALLALKDNEMRARLIGYNVNRLRFMIFVIAAAPAGLSGALYALLARYTNLEFFHWTYSGQAVVAAVIGGVQSLVGPFIGTAIYMLAAEHLSRYVESFIIVVAIILFIVVRFAPNGVWGVTKALFGGKRRP